MADTYGLPAGTSITYGSPGFPQWIYDLCFAFGLKASTYPNHQTGERAEAGFAPNPDNLNRGIDFTGGTDAMQRFAEYLLSIHTQLEQVIWMNPVTGQKIGVAGGDDVSFTAYYAQDWSGHTDHVHVRTSRPIPVPNTTRPPFTEVEVWGYNRQARNGTKVDLFLLHTQEGGDGDAVGLARWLNSNGVSYHYTVSTGRPAVTVADVVDTDYASWSVLSANNRSINLCFAGSRASWSRQQWLDNAVSIDTAAFLAVQDCRKYGIPIHVIAPPYTSGRAGISDHNYVTEILHDGTHTDVGPNFPWDMFADAVAKHANLTTGGEDDWMATNEEKLDYIYREFTKRYPSRSPLRHLGEGPVDTAVGMGLNVDGNLHPLIVKFLAELGVTSQLELLAEIAGADLNRYPDRRADATLARLILDDIARTRPQVIESYIAQKKGGPQ